MQAVKLKAEKASSLITKDPTLPAFVVTGREAISIRAGTMFNGRRFAKPTPIRTDKLKPGADYAIWVDRGISGISITELAGIPEGNHLLGGFHFAPGGNAKARAGGDDRPAINPYSLWDCNLRPGCPDPRGMTFMVIRGEPGWYDIYKLGKDHLINGTSKFGVTIADGSDPPQNPAGGYFSKLDYIVACKVMAHHGKTLVSFDEFTFIAHGVTEKTAAPRDPVTTGLDAPRTSQIGIMQASGNVYDWGHDGDPDLPRASVFGGSWLSDVNAGSRCAYVGHWPAVSSGSLGARGRCDPWNMTRRRASAGRQRR